MILPKIEKILVQPYCYAPFQQRIQVAINNRMQFLNTRVTLLTFAINSN
jgi:hypothetical protein